MARKHPYANSVIVWILFIVIDGPVVMDQVSVTMKAALLIAGSGVDYGAVGQHGSPLVGHMDNVEVAFQALVILNVRIGCLTIFLTVIFGEEEMLHKIFGPVIGLGIKEVKSVMGSRQVAIHAVRHKALGIVDMRGGSPGFVSRLNFVTTGAELRGGGAHHGVIGEAEEGKGHDNPKKDIENRLEKFSHGNPEGPQGLVLLKNLSAVVLRHKAFTSSGKKTEHGHKRGTPYKIFRHKSTLF